MELDVSVIIPALNAGPYIRQQLEALANQDFDGQWEVIVADNGSVDDTREIVRGNVDLVRHLRLTDASDRKGVAAARNRGAAAAKGRYLAFCDADDIVSPWWLRSLLANPDGHAICYGELAFFRGTAPDPSHFAGPPSTSSGGLLTYPFDYLPFASGGNFLVERSVFDEMGGFDEAYGAGEDVDFCWRAQYAGHALGSAPGALILIRDRGSAMSQFRQYLGYGRGEVHLFRDHSPRGMPRSSTLRAVLVYAWLIGVGMAALVRRDPYYRLWVNAAGRRFGRIAGSWHFRRVYL